MLSFFSCKRKWTEKDKSEFLGGCMNNAMNNKDVVNAKAYCNCLLEKIVAKYPNANDMQYAKYDSTNAKLAKDCLKQH